MTFLNDDTTILLRHHELPIVVVSYGGINYITWPVVVQSFVPLVGCFLRSSEGSDMSFALVFGNVGQGTFPLFYFKVVALKLESPPD